MLSRLFQIVLKNNENIRKQDRKVIKGNVFPME